MDRRTSWCAGPPPSSSFDSVVDPGEPQTSGGGGGDVAAASLTLGAAVGVFGLVFGVGAVAAGGSVLQACVMSLLVFTGASQFSAVSVVAAGGGTSAALGGAMVLAARNAVYGLAMSRVITGSLARRAVAAQLTIDESTAMASVQHDLGRQAPGLLDHRGDGVRLLEHWRRSIGALIGSAIEPETYGLDVAFPAGFRRHGRAPPAPPLGTGRGDARGSDLPRAHPVHTVGVPILCSSAAVLVGLRAPDAAHPDDLPDEGVIV